MNSEINRFFQSFLKCVNCFIVIAFTTFYAQGQTKALSINEAVDRLDQTASTTEYLELKNDFQTIAQRDSSDWLPLYYIAYCNVRLGFLVKDDDNKNKFYSDAALYAIKQAEGKSFKFSFNNKAEIYNLYSMAYRVRIAARPMINGRKFGPIANDYLEKALKLSPNNPRSLYLSGQVKYLTPIFFGGDKKKAKELLTVSLQKFNEQQSSSVQPHWGKKDCQFLLSKIN